MINSQNLEKTKDKFEKEFSEVKHQQYLKTYKDFNSTFNSARIKSLTPIEIYNPHRGDRDTFHHWVEYKIFGGVRIYAKVWKEAKQNCGTLKNLLLLLKDNSKIFGERFESAMNSTGGYYIKWFREGLITKIFSAFYPNKVVPIFNIIHKKHFLHFLDVPFNEKYESVAEEFDDTNQLLLRARDRLLSTYTLVKFVMFLYESDFCPSPLKHKINTERKQKEFLEKYVEKRVSYYPSSMLRKNPGDLLNECKQYKGKFLTKTKTTTVTQRLADERQKERVKVIEGYKCQICEFFFYYRNVSGKMVPYAEIHHIKKKAEGGDENLSNLVVLCPNCHKKADKGVLQFDCKKKIVLDEGRQVQIKDKHLFIG